jgi:hypothetical protein
MPYAAGAVRDAAGSNAPGGKLGPLRSPFRIAPPKGPLPPAAAAAASAVAMSNSVAAAAAARGPNGPAAPHGQAPGGAQAGAARMRGRQLSGDDSITLHVLLLAHPHFFAIHGSSAVAVLQRNNVLKKPLVPILQATWD